MESMLNTAAPAAATQATAAPPPGGGGAAGAPPLPPRQARLQLLHARKRQMKNVSAVPSATAATTWTIFLAGNYSFTPRFPGKFLEMQIA